MKSAFEMDVDLSGNAGLESGKRYVFEIEDAILREKVVQWNDQIPKDARGKEFDTLPQNIKDELSKIELTYPSGDPAPIYQDRVTISLRETTTGRRIRYGLEFIFREGGKPTKDFYNFCAAIGRPLRDSGQRIKFREILPQGTKFSAVVIKDAKGFDSIDRDSVGPVDLVSQESDKETKIYEPLTNTEVELMNLANKYKTMLNNAPTSVVFDWIMNITTNGETKMTFGEAMGIWKTLAQKKNLIQNGKIVLE